jgi:hypothetical protein
MGHLLSIGFTGSRTGMGPERQTQLERLLRRMSEGGRFVFHHGDCVGADAEAHAVARELGAWIVAHPAYPLGHPMRAGRDADVVLPTRPSLARNAVIVASADEMVATPNGPEVQRSGTWSTIRAAWRAGLPVHLLLPEDVATTRCPSDGEGERSEADRTQDSPAPDSDREPAGGEDA